MPMGMITSAPRVMNRFASLTKFCTTSSRWAAKSGKSKPLDAKTDNALFHAVTAHDGAVKGEQFFVIDNQAETVAEQRGDVKARLHRTDNGNIHGRSAAIDG